MKHTAFSLVILIALLLPSAVQAAPDPVPGKGLYFINLASDPQGAETHFRYELRNAGAPAITDIVLHACTGQLLRVVVDSFDGVKIHTEPNDVIKIEMMNMADYETKVITLVMRGPGWSARPTTYSLTAGQITLRDTKTYGPRCTTNAVTLTQLSAGPSTRGWVGFLLAQFGR